MSDEDRTGFRKGSIAKHVIRMAVGIDDIADRLVGPGANGGKQLLSFLDAAAGVDHGDRVVTDDESDIGDGSLVLARHQRDIADVDEEARCDLRDGQRLLRAQWRRCAEHCDHDEQ